MAVALASKAEPDAGRHAAAVFWLLPPPENKSPQRQPTPHSLWCKGKPWQLAFQAGCRGFESRLPPAAPPFSAWFAGAARPPRDGKRRNRYQPAAAAATAPTRARNHAECRHWTYMPSAAPAVIWPRPDHDLKGECQCPQQRN